MTRYVHTKVSSHENLEKGTRTGASIEQGSVGYIVYDYKYDLYSMILIGFQIVYTSMMKIKLKRSSS